MKWDDRHRKTGEDSGYEEGFDLYSKHRTDSRAGRPPSQEEIAAIRQAAIYSGKGGDDGTVNGG